MGSQKGGYLKSDAKWINEYLEHEAFLAKKALERILPGFSMSASIKCVLKLSFFF